MFYSYTAPSTDSAVLHDTEEAYLAALADGHKDTPAPEAWEAVAPPKRGPGRPPKTPDSVEG